MWKHLNNRYQPVFPYRSGADDLLIPHIRSLSEQILPITASMYLDVDLVMPLSAAEATGNCSRNCPSAERRFPRYGKRNLICAGCILGVAGQLLFLMNITSVSLEPVSCEVSHRTFLWCAVFSSGAMLLRWPVENRQACGGSDVLIYEHGSESRFRTDFCYYGRNSFGGTLTEQRRQQQSSLQRQFA